MGTSVSYVTVDAFDMAKNASVTVRVRNLRQLRYRMVLLTMLLKLASRISPLTMLIEYEEQLEDLQ